MLADSIPLLLFAKAPIAGQVKTRLQPHCSDQQAAAIAQILLEQSIIKAKQYWPGIVYLSVWLDRDHEFLLQMSSKYSVPLVDQAEGDLGDKMHAAFEQFGYPAAILGCDAPHLQGPDLVVAYELLQKGQTVLGPALDGGYYFIGLHSGQSSIFTNMPWGTEQVLQRTLNAMRATPRFLAELNDVDRWEDLLEASNKLPALHQYLVGAKLLAS